MMKQPEAPLSLSDCRCNICMDIFLEPVTLPCHHTLCNPCFQFTVEKASLCCPFCRRRVSSWARYNTRNKTLINSELWEKIQKYFPEECQRRINGQDLEEETSVPQPVHCLSKPGELRQEYEAEITKAEAERRAHEQEERKASEEYIQKLLAEEENEQKLAEEKKKHMVEQLLHDEMLAHELSFSLNSSTEENIRSSLSPSPSPSNYCRTSKSKSSNSGDIKKYLSPKSYNAIPARLLFRKSEEERIDPFSVESNKSNFTSGEKKEKMPALSPQLTGEARNIKDSVPYLTTCTTAESNPSPSHFSRCQTDELSSVSCREICATECLFSKGAIAGCDFKCENFTDNIYLANSTKFSPQESGNQQDDCIKISCHAEIESSQVENRSQALNITKEIPEIKSQESPSEETIETYINEKRKRISSQSDEDEIRDMNVEQQIRLEQQIYEKRKQEEEDRRLALKLQRELDKDKSLNRKKGSPDEYLLRPTTSQSAKESPSARKHCKLSKNPKPTDRQSEIGKKTRRGSYNENWKPSNKLRSKSSVKESNIWNGVHNSPNSKDAEFLPSKQKTILQMFKGPSTN